MCGQPPCWKPAQLAPLMCRRSRSELSASGSIHRWPPLEETRKGVEKTGKPRVGSSEGDGEGGEGGMGGKGGGSGGERTTRGEQQWKPVQPLSPKPHA